MRAKATTPRGCARPAIAAAVALAALVASGIAHAAPGDRLLPDLVTEPFDEAYIEGEPGNKVLRFSNTVGNRGVGPLEVLSKAEDTGVCPDPGDRPAYQRVYVDSADPDSAGFFLRGSDTDFRRRLAGCVEFHPDHLHWHFEQFTRYALRSEATGDTVANSTKVSFCIVDNGHRFPELPGSPQFQYYDQCEDPDEITGLSVGWADTYGAGLAGQHLDVTGLPDGDYCLISRADPANRLRELDDSNNRRKARYYLDVGRGHVLPRERRCQV